MRVRQFGEDVARSRPRQSEDGDVVGDVVDGDAPFPAAIVLFSGCSRPQPTEVVIFGTGSRHHQEFIAVVAVVVVQIGNRQFGVDFALGLIM